MNLYRQILGKDWDNVHPKVRNSHSSGETLHATCRLDVSGSLNVIGKIIGRIVSFPKPARSAPVDLYVTPSEHDELWERRFPDRNLKSIQSVSPDGLLIDRFRCIAFGFHLEAIETGITHHHVHTYLIFWRLKLRVPMFISPRIMSSEEPEPGEEASRINVGVRIPMIGNILTYNGIVRPVKETP